MIISLSLALAQPGLDQEQWRTRSETTGAISPTSSPVSMFSEIRLGAWGAGILVWDQSTPFEVVQMIFSPNGITDELAMVVREDAQFLAHVVDPEDIGIGGADLDRWLLGAGHVLSFLLHSLVAIGVAFDIEAEDFTAVGDDEPAVPPRWVGEEQIPRNSQSETLPAPSLGPPVARGTCRSSRQRP